MGLLRRRRTSGGVLIAMAGASALISVALGLRGETAAAVATGTGTSADFTTAAQDILLMGLGVAVLQASIVAVRVASERLPEARTFVVLGAPVSTLVAARMLEFATLGLAGGLVGVVVTWPLVALFSGAGGSPSNVASIFAASLGIPLLALFPAALWTSWDLARAWSRE